MRVGTYYRYILFKKLGIFKDIMKDYKLLDVGGFDGFTLSQLMASKKVLIDPNTQKKYERISYLKDNFFNYDFKKQKFNFILSFDVLEHIPKEKEVEYFLKIYSLLEKGGIAIITTPSNDIKTFPNFLRMWIGKKWGHYKCLGYAKEELVKLIDNTKIRKYKIYSCQSRYYLNSYLLIKFLYIIFPDKIIKRLLTLIGNKDAKLDYKLCKGYYLLSIRK